MNTPIIDAFAIKFKTPCGEKYWVPVDIARKLERERDEVWEKYDLEAVENMLAVNKIRHERDEARGQRDRLAEVIEAASVLIAAKGRHNTMLAYNGLRDALQSLTQPTEP